MARHELAPKLRSAVASEKEAVSDYGAGIKHASKIGDKKSKEVFKHAQGEEKQHVTDFVQRLNQVSAVGGGEEKPSVANIPKRRGGRRMA